MDRLLIGRLRERSPWLAGLVFPTAVVMAEYTVATFTPFGAVQGVLGATQAGNLPLIQVVPVTGVYGVSFLLAWLASAVALWWEQGRDDGPARWAVFGAVTVVAAVTLAGGARLAFTQSGGDTVRIAGVSTSRTSWEGGVPTFREYGTLEALVAADPEELRERFAVVNGELLESTAREARAGAAVVVWPESAAFTLEEGEDDLIEWLRDLARTHGVHVQAAMSVYTEEAPHIRNQVVLVASDGTVEWTYEKAHPIPVLEPYDPGTGVLPILDTPFGRMSTVICFDADFPGLLRQVGAADVDVLPVPANTWEGIKEMHARNAVFRAVESGASLFRQASRGRANAVDPHGRTIATTDYFTSEQQTMVAYVPTEGVTTVYSRIGDVFAWLCALVLAVLAVLALRHRHGARRG